MKSSSITRRLSMMIALLVGIGTVFVVSVNVLNRYHIAARIIRADQERIEESIVPVLSYLVWVVNDSQAIQLGEGIGEIPSVVGVSVKLSDGETLYHWAGNQYWLDENEVETREGVVVYWPLAYERGDESFPLGTLKVTFLPPWKYAAVTDGLYAQIVPNIVLATIVLLVVALAFRRQISGPLQKLQHDLEALDLTQALPWWWTDARTSDRNVETSTVREVVTNSAARIRREIEERKASERKLARWLTEKDILLREIHHRVKNNLQLVISLLALQRQAISEDVSRRALADSEHRVMSMSLVHELLYRGDDLGAIRLNEYLTDLTRAIVSAADHDNLEIAPRFDLAADRPVPLDIAIPLGIVVTEILTNAVKHAFPGRHRGTLTVSTAGTDDKHLIVTICDDGCGMPDNGGTSGSSLGMELVRTLCDQLEAEWEFTSGTGNPGLGPGLGDAVGTCFSATITDDRPSPSQP